MKMIFILLLSVFPIIARGAIASYQLPAAPPEATRDGPAKAAVEMFRDGRRAAAVEMARPLADAGDGDALFLMGFSMEGMEPAKLSRGQAMDYYYRKAAAAGHPEAEWRRNLIPLAAGKEKERAEGRQALEAAAAGNPRAARILGEAWLRGLVDGKPDRAKAEQYWKDAGGKGDTAPWILLARLYEGSFGFPEAMNRELSIVHYRKAAEAGDEDAFVPLGQILYAGGKHDEGRAWLEKAIKVNMHSAWCVLGDQEEKGGDAAVARYRKGADAGDAQCMLRLAGISTERAEGRAWLKKSADAGSPAAAAELGGQMLQEKSDPTGALDYLLFAAKEGIWQAQYAIGLHYLEGRPDAPDPVAAVAWLTQAMKGGDAEVQYKLAMLHEQGVGGPVNYANAGVLYTLASNKGHAGAATRIAWMAMEGLGTERNPVQAKAHAMLALERGDESARIVLAQLEGKLDAADTSEAEKTLVDLRAGMKKQTAAGVPGESAKPTQ